MKNWFMLYYSQYDPIRDLSDEDIGKLFRALMLYNDNPENPVGLSPIVGMAFNFFKKQLEIDAIKYEKKVNANRENGQRWWRPSQNNPENPVGLQEPRKPDKDKDKDKDNVKDKEIKKKVNLEEEVLTDTNKEIYWYWMLKDFLNYWTESPPGGGRQRRQAEKFFEIPKRLRTWKSRQKESYQDVNKRIWQQVTRQNLTSNQSKNGGFTKFIAEFEAEAHQADS